MLATSDSSAAQWRQCRCLAICLSLLASLLVIFAAPTGSISAAVPITRPDSTNTGIVGHVLSHHFREDDNHREVLIKRHEQISSMPVAGGFVYPTHLHRRNADALPAPNKAYVLNVTQGTISPDGFERLGFLMNGKFPADPFVWDENDDVEIIVNNQSPVPFAIHWHGIHQIGTPEMDGVPGLSQWNIYTGESYTYRFKMTNQYGGYWYHSHERGYYADGLRGTIYVRPKPDRKKPWSLISSEQDDIEQMEAAEKDFQVMQLSDHWHVNHTDMLLIVHETGVPPACFDSLHINGRGRQYCLDDWSAVISPITQGLLKNFTSTNPEGITSKGCISLVPPKAGYTVKGVLDGRYGGTCKNTTAPLTVFSAAKAIKEGRKWLNLQIIDTATNDYYGFSIDSHKMWIVAVDGHYVEPMEVDWAQITIGSRLSVMVELNQDYDGYVFPIRLTAARPLQPIEGHGFLSYIDEIDGTWSPDIEEDFGYVMRETTDAHVLFSGFVVDASIVKWKQNLSTPFDPISKVPQESSMTLHAVASQNSLNVWQVATMPLDTARLADDRPMLFNMTDGNATSNQLTPYATIPFGTVVDLIMENNIYSIVGGPNSPHPFHMHSRRFWVIGSGAGPFPTDTVAEAQALGYKFNLDTPPLRDGFDIDSNSWVVIRYIVDHAAANILHCHIDDHAIEGMAAVLLEGLETIPAGGNFSESIKVRPSGWVGTQNDELGKVLGEAIATGSANARYVAPPITETVSPWGDPRALANSIQLIASSNSVQRSITSSLQSALSLAQATATEKVAGIIATVLNDHLTTFSGVPESNTAAVASATPTVAALTTAVADPARSTLLAAANTTRAATVAFPAQTAVSPAIDTAPSAALATSSGAALVSALTTPPAAVPATSSGSVDAIATRVATAPATALATPPTAVFATQPASAIATPLVTAPNSTPAAVVAPVLATASADGSANVVAAGFTALSSAPSAATLLSSRATIPATIQPSLIATAPVSAAVSASLPAAASVSFPASVSAVAPATLPAKERDTGPAVQSTSPSATNAATQIGTAVATASASVGVTVFTTQVQTAPFLAASSAVVNVGQPAASTSPLASAETETELSAATRTASPAEATALSDKDSETESTTAFDTGDGAAEESGLGSASVLAASTRAASVSVLNTALASTLEADFAALTGSSTRIFSALRTQQVISQTVASLNLVASATQLHSPQETISPSDTSPQATTQIALSTLSSQTSFATASRSSASAEATPVGTSSPNPAAYGLRSASVTFAVAATANEVSPAAPAAASATAIAAQVSDEPAYDNPVFPPKSAVATGTAAAAFRSATS
ncbi:related to Laccase I precursor [Melanopsichium pennsylvanicum]|uniref:Related to Laccase I n=2 Tax=Melanopsichium pennsylvanicum TaxID=63383 RepID=A0AAJ4XT50_9BASI|nr:related to Laccase I precursor [Melanopsichium pennsylvanicum 4]SNX87441.1 related to Laccase I precursor [Melanopsichium pennsylvanicum]